MTDASLHSPTTPTFTYSHSGQPRLRRALIRGVERLSGQPRLRSLYTNWAAAPQPGEAVFDAALRMLDVTPARRWTTPAAHIPRTGGLLLIANHPFGIIDGLALCQLGLQLRGNVQILTNSVLCQPAEITPHLLPIDFSGTPQARKTSAQSRRLAIDLLAAGKTVAMFPAGGISTANDPLSGTAFDAAWHPFVARLATISGVTTLPVHFAGQNSRLFQIASHLSYPLRIALVFHETRRRMGTALPMTIGAPIIASTLSEIPKDEVTAYLRGQTMSLGAERDETFLWPSHIRW